MVAKGFYAKPDDSISENGEKSWRFFEVLKTREISSQVWWIQDCAVGIWWGFIELDVAFDVDLVLSSANREVPTIQNSNFLYTIWSIFKKEKVNCVI